MKTWLQHLPFRKQHPAPRRNPNSAYDDECDDASHENPGTVPKTGTSRLRDTNCFSHRQRRTRAQKKKKTPALLMVFLLVGMLILLLLTLWLVVLLLMSPVGLTLRRVLVHVVISLSAVLMLVMSLIGGSLLTFLFLFAFAFVPGWLTLLAQLYVSPVGLLVG